MIEYSFNWQKYHEWFQYYIKGEETHSRKSHMYTNPHSEKVQSKKGKFMTWTPQTTNENKNLMRYRLGMVTSKTFATVSFTFKATLLLSFGLSKLYRLYDVSDWIWLFMILSGWNILHTAIFSCSLCYKKVVLRLK